MTRMAVRLVSATADRHISAELAEGYPRFRSVVPGGFASCEMALHRPLRLTPDEVADFARVYVYHGGHGGVLWEGDLEDPGRSRSPSGEVYSLTAVGPSARFGDVTRPVVYVDHGMTDQREPTAASQRSWNIDGDTDGSGDPALRIAVPRGVVAGTNHAVSVLQLALADIGQDLARADFRADCGVTDTKWRVQMLSYPSATLLRDHPATTAGITSSPKFLGGTIPADDNVLAFRVLYDDATPQTVANDATWFVYGGILLRGQLFNADGSEKTTGYGNDYVLASEVFADLLGRRLPRFDGANATITATAYGIDQLAYYDGASPREIADDLLVFHPDYYYAGWESNAAGLHRVEFVPWPTTVRYELNTTDGYDAPSSGADLLSAVNVRWRNPRGRIRTTRVTQVVPALVAAGISRETTIDLGDDVGSAAAATVAGNAELAKHAGVPNGGTVTVRRPVYDTIEGRMVDPEEIRPGNLCRIGDLEPHLDALNATASNGVTVAKVIAVDASPGEARLELDASPRDLSAIVAQMRRERRRRR